MPNTFTALDVPVNDGSGVSFVTRGLGRPKTIVFSGPVLGRYIVEGSNDGGTNWDILVDDSGQQAFFTTQAPGVRTFDCIVDRVRVRSVGNASLAGPPTIALGAPPAIGTPVFGVLDMPVAPGLGAPFDLGVSAGAFKTFILRGAIPPGSRYTILGSIDGVRFDEVMLFTSDQQGARPVEFFCRFLRVQRAAGGPTPVLAFGCEGILEPVTAPTDVSIGEEGQVASSSPSGEEVLRQYRVPLALLAPASLRLALAGEGRGPTETGRNVTFRVRAGGAPDVADGTEVLAVPDLGPSDAPVYADSAPFPRPTDASTLVKVTGQGDGTVPAVLRNFVLLFHAAAS
jgi:hypothetical protein